ncbi:hypothetical protein LGZ99_21575 [Photorhabdus temperata]|uniref:hypothetical protein n=1 Tax=Photorhabdus temperata TaxID=574560 RepID=UPI0021D517B5|nr:hypothetical protein [Photorhabdus temperata]MCT8349718.1 hypothetical protein [Photorhabdus temperata]
MTEYVPVKDVKGRYIRDERMINWTKGRNASSFGYVSKHSLPSGRFLLQLYSPYNSTKWVKLFKQTKECSLISQIPKIIQSLYSAVPQITQQIEEAKRKEKEWRIEWERKNAVYERQERILKAEEAREKSQAELQSIMVQWGEDKRVEQFFSEVEADALKLDQGQREQVLERLRLARQFLSSDSAIERLLNWKTPQERLEN